jgi:hypothetical protein
VSKGAKTAAVVVFVVLLIGGSGVAYALTKHTLNATRLPLPGVGTGGPPPPAPGGVAGDLKVIGSAIVAKGGALVSSGYETVTGSKLSTGQVAANVATGGLAAPVEAAYSWAKKLF